MVISVRTAHSNVVTTWKHPQNVLVMFAGRGEWYRLAPQMRYLVYNYKLKTSRMICDSDSTIPVVEHVGTCVEFRLVHWVGHQDAIHQLIRRLVPHLCDSILHDDRNHPRSWHDLESMFV